MNYKAFILLAWDSHYPFGGLSDVFDSYDTAAEARRVAKKRGFQNYQIVNRKTWEIVFTGEEA